MSNACGQGRYAGLSLAAYQDSNPCAEDEALMACPVNPATVAVASTKGIYEGSPPPLECYPRTPTEMFTGAWDPSLFNADGQTMGKVDPSSIPSANSFGRKDVEGCCWWGRGAFPRGSSGTCVIGKLNHYLGKQAYDQGRSTARYKETDFCTDPSAICRGYSKNPEANAEVRWLMGMMYWINTVQKYDQNGWSYLEKLKQFTDGGGIDAEFLEQVSRIVTRGCHDQSSCGYAVSSDERHAKFNKIFHYFGFESVYTSNKDETVVPFPSKRPTFLPKAKPTKPPTFLPTVEPINPPTTLPTAKPTKPPTFIPTAKPINPPTTLPKVKPRDLPTVLVNPTKKPTKTSMRQNPPSTHPTARATEDTEIRSSSSPPNMVPSQGIPLTISKGDYELTAGELTNRLSYANNYCASSEEEVNTKCATSSLRTCNFGDPPCTQGSGCYKDMICKIIWSDIQFESDQNEPEVETGRESRPESGLLLRALVSCNGRCLRPLSDNECTSVVGDAVAFIPNCLSVAVGEMCEHQGECGVGANIHISKCPGDREIFMRVFVEQCSTSATEPPSTSGKYQSLPPSTHLSFSSKPSSSDGYHLNSTHVNASDGKNEEFTELLPTNKEIDFPGAWWTGSYTNGSTRMHQEPFLLLLCLAVASSTLCPW